MKKETLNVIDEITKIRQNRTQLHGATEQNFNKIAEFWSVYKGVNFTADDVGIMMALLKFARIINGDGTNIDNYIDGANYIALAGELKYNKQIDFVVEKTEANIDNNLENLEIKQTKPGIITLEVLKEKNAPEDFVKYFEALEKQEWEIIELIEKFAKDSKRSYVSFLFESNCINTLEKLEDIINFYIKKNCVIDNFVFEFCKDLFTKELFKKTVKYSYKEGFVYKNPAYYYYCKNLPFYKEVMQECRIENN